MHGKADELPLQIVKRRVDGGACGELLAREPVEDLVEGERIVTEAVGVVLEIGERGLRRLVVAVDRRRFPEAGDAVLRDLDLHDLRVVA